VSFYIIFGVLDAVERETTYDEAGVVGWCALSTRVHRVLLIPPRATPSPLSLALVGCRDIALIMLDAGTFSWMYSSITALMKGLAARGESAKLRMYQRLMRVHLRQPRPLRRLPHARDRLRVRAPSMHALRAPECADVRVAASPCRFGIPVFPWQAYGLLVTLLRRHGEGRLGPSWCACTGSAAGNPPLFPTAVSRRVCGGGVDLGPRQSSPSSTLSTRRFVLGGGGRGWGGAWAPSCTAF